MSDLSSLLTGDASDISPPPPCVSLGLSPLCTRLEQTYFLPSLHEGTPPSLWQSASASDLSSSQQSSPSRLPTSSPDCDGDSDDGNERSLGDQTSRSAPEASSSPTTSSRSRRRFPTSNIVSDPPRRIYPLPSPVSLRFSTAPVGYRDAFKRCLLQSHFTTEPLSTVFLPLLWPSLDLSPEDLARVLGHRNKWAAPLPARTSTIPPRKADPFLRFFSFLLKGFRGGIDRSQITARLTQNGLPPGDPIPIHDDLVTAFQSIVGDPPPAKHTDHPPTTQILTGPPSDEAHLPRGSAPTEGAIEFVESPTQTYSTSQAASPHSVHPTRWPEAVSHLGLSYFHRPRSITPLQLLRALPAVTTADLLYLTHQSFNHPGSVLDDLRRGAEILCGHALSLRNHSSTDRTLARDFLSPLSCVRLAAFAQSLSRVDVSDLPLLVRTGLPPSSLFAIADLFHLGRLGPPFRIVPALVGISPMTLRSRAVNSRGGRLSPTESDTVVRLLVLFGTLARVFSNLPALRSWCHGERGGLRPLSLICNSPIGLSSGLLFRFRQALLSDRPSFW